MIRKILCLPLLLWTGLIYGIGITVDLDPSTPAEYELARIVDVGDTIDIDILALDVTNLGAYEFKLSYDTTVLWTKKQWITRGPFLRSDGANTIFFPTYEPGMLDAAESIYNPDSSNSPDSSGVIVYVKFAAIGEGVSELNFTQVDLRNDGVWLTLDDLDIVGNGVLTVIAVDTCPPHFTSTTIWTDTTYRGPYEVNSTITDPSGISQAILYYRISPDTNYQSVVMDSNSYYHATIPEIDSVSDTVKVDYYLYAKDNADNEGYDPINGPDSAYSFIVFPIQGIEEEFNPVPNSQLLQCYPNPFSTKTVIRARLSCSYQHESPARAIITIHDIAGRLIRSFPITDNRKPTTEVSWDGKDSNGRFIPSGIYFCQLKSAGVTKTKKISKIW